MAIAAVLAHRALAREEEDETQRGCGREAILEDPRYHDFKDNPSEKLANDLGFEWPQLSRKTFADRMDLESVMVDNTIQFALYLVLVVLYLISVCQVDPIGYSSVIGQELRNHFDVEGLADKRTIDDVMSYTQTFFQKAFELSPAMVDVHTRNLLDVSRCFDSDASDICSATRFWEAAKIPDDTTRWAFDSVGPQQQSSILTPACELDMCGNEPCGYKGLQEMPFEFRWGNVTVKEMDYRQQSSRGSTCMYRASQQLLWDFFNDPGNATWLTPEKPLMLQRIKPYTRPYMVVTTPIVMQQRGMVKPCRGLGSQYVNDLTGYCQDPHNCDPGKVTSIDNAYSHPFSQRSYTAWVSYNEPVVQCVDYGDEDPDFKDKSFNTWSTYDVFNQGWSQTGLLKGEEVFWRFASDIRHLQAPLEPQLVCPTILQSMNSTDPASSMFRVDEYGIKRPNITDTSVCKKCVDDAVCADYFFRRYAAEMIRWSPLATGRQMLRLAHVVDSLLLHDLYVKFVVPGQQDLLAVCHALALIVEGNDDMLLRQFSAIQERCGDLFPRADWKNASQMTHSAQEREAPAIACTDLIWLDQDMGCPGHDPDKCRVWGGASSSCCSDYKDASCANGYVKRRDNSRTCGMDRGFCCIPPGRIALTFHCASGGRCIPEFNRCNGIVNCDDGSDEQACNATGPAPAPVPDPTGYFPNWLAQLFSPEIFMTENRMMSFWGNFIPPVLPNPTITKLKSLRDKIVLHVAERLKKNSMAKDAVKSYIDGHVQSLDPMKDEGHELWCMSSENCLMYQKCLSDASKEQTKYDDWLGQFVNDQDRRSRLRNFKKKEEDAKCKAKLYYILENVLMSDTAFKPYPSVRRLWENSFMDPATAKKNTFLTRATSKYMLALLLVTPQAEGLPEIITIVQVSFEFGQYGGIATEFSLVSATGELRHGWFSLMISTIVVAALYLLVNIGLSVYRASERRAVGEHATSCRREIIDSVLPLVMAFQLIVLWRMSDEDFSKELENAFRTSGVAGREKELFKFYADLVARNYWVNVVKMWGIITAYAMFVRLVAYMAMHPRIALLVHTMYEIADDLLHFAISFMLIFFMMGILAFWMFGTDSPDFDSPNKAMYMQFRMVTGDFDFLGDQDDPDPLFYVYAVTFVVLVAFVLLNFFLAIVVDGFMIAKASVKVNEAENTFAFDLMLVTVRLINIWRGIYPSARALRRYMQDGLEEKLALASKSEIQLQVLGESRAANAVTANELYESVRGRGNQRLFRSVDHARTFLLGYAKRFPHFIENDLELCWKQGQSMNGLKSSNMGPSAPKRSSLMGAIHASVSVNSSPSRPQITKSALSDVAEDNETGNQAREGLPSVTEKIKSLRTGMLTRVIMAATHRIAEIQAVEADFEWSDPGRASPVRM